MENAALYVNIGKFVRAKIFLSSLPAGKRLPVTAFFHFIPRFAVSGAPNDDTI